MTVVNPNSTYRIDREASAAAILKARLSVGYTEERFAREVGVNLATVRSWQRGFAVPAPWNRQKIAQVLGRRVESLWPPVSA